MWIWRISALAKKTRGERKSRCNLRREFLQFFTRKEKFTYREYWVWRVDSTCGWLHFRLRMCNWLGLFLGLELWSSDHLRLECNLNLFRVGLLLGLSANISVNIDVQIKGDSMWNLEIRVVMKVKNLRKLEISSLRPRPLDSRLAPLVIMDSITNWQKSTNHHSHPWFWHSFGWMAPQLDLAAKFYTLWVWRHLELLP